MEVIFLGTGTSHGIPMIACDCAVCTSDDPRNRRTRSSVHVVMDGLRIQVDAAPEFRLQCVREKITHIDLFILTHGHADHVVGMDDLRRFCDNRDDALPVYASDEGMARVLAIYPYAILDRPVMKGYAAFRLNEMQKKLTFPQGTIESTLLPHGGVNTLGLVFTEKSSGKRFAYYTDCKRVTAEAAELARHAEVVVLDGLRPQEHATHMSISEALAAAATLRGDRTFLTHMAHAVDHAVTEATFPEDVRLAYDGLRLSI